MGVSYEEKREKIDGNKDRVVGRARVGVRDRDG